MRGGVAISVTATPAAAPRRIREVLRIINPEWHEYELYLAVEDIDHSLTKTKSPQTNVNEDQAR
jgi:hypothetical protein